jgi:hypothetical protein
MVCIAVPCFEVLSVPVVERSPAVLPVAEQVQQLVLSDWLVLSDLSDWQVIRCLKLPFLMKFFLLQLFALPWLIVGCRRCSS